MGPLFAAVLSRALDQWWRQLGRPDPFVVIEAGAGAGTLARDVLASAGSCARALRYVLVERSEPLRARQSAALALEPPAGMFGPPAADDEDDDRRPAAGEAAGAGPGRGGPVATSLADLPAQPVTGVVLANELLDNLPFRLLERRAPDQGGPEAGAPGAAGPGAAGPGAGWLEVRVGEEGGRLVEVLVPAPENLAGQADGAAPHAGHGARIPLQLAAQAWLRQALSVLEAGRVVVFDYADTTPSMARRPWLEWVRTYRAHQRGGDPLDLAGRQDVTCEVAADQLAGVRPPASDCSQADFLAAHGIGELVAAARDRWAAGAAGGGLEAVKARSRVSEAAALVDPAGLGSFRVLEWEVP